MPGAEQNQNSQIPLSEYAARPDVASAVMRSDNFAEGLIRDNPEIKVGKRLLGNYIIAYMPVELLTRIGTETGGYRGIFSVVLGTLSATDLEAAGISGVQRQPYLNLTGRDVILGFIDTGIDYTLQAFRYEDGTTRVRYLWDQTAAGAPPAGYASGAEYTAEQIDAALRSENPRSIVPSEDESGHGTFLASLAGSRERGEFAGAAPDAEFVVVKLKKASPFYFDLYRVPDTQQEAFESADLMLGIQYIIDKARELDRPAALCIGIGTNFGGHDGFSILEEYLTRVSFQPGIAIAAAAGDESSARHHFQGKVAGARQTALMEVRAGDGASSLFINMWNTSSDRLSVSVISPAGETVGRFAAKSGATFSKKLVLERSTVTVQYFYPIEGSGNQLTVIVVDDPTPGVWKIDVYGEIIIDGAFHAWLPLKNFTDPSVEFLSPSPDYTVVVPATSTGVITAGAFNALTKGLFSESSWGPTLISSPSPDLVAPGVDVGGIFPTGYGTMSGTSASAAITAGACALMLDWGVTQGNDPSLNTYLIKPRLIRGCDREPGIIYPNPQWGYGRLNLLNTFYQLRGA